MSRRFCAKECRGRLATALLLPAPLSGSFFIGFAFKFQPGSGNVCPNYMLKIVIAALKQSNGFRLNFTGLRKSLFTGIRFADEIPAYAGMTFSN